MVKLRRCCEGWREYEPVSVPHECSIFVEITATKDSIVWDCSGDEDIGAGDDYITRKYPDRKYVAKLSDYKDTDAFFEFKGAIKFFDGKNLSMEDFNGSEGEWIEESSGDVEDAISEDSMISLLEVRITEEALEHKSYEELVEEGKKLDEEVSCTFEDNYYYEQEIEYDGGYEEM